MLSSVRYATTGDNFVWPIPFPYGADADVGVTLADSVGRERRLSLGSDYVVQNGNVICVAPASHWLCVFLDGVADFSANARRVLSASAQAAEPAASAESVVAASEPGPATVYQADTELLANLSAKLEAALANPAADARILELEKRLDEILARQQKAQALAVEQARQDASDQQLAAIQSRGEKIGS